MSAFPINRDMLSTTLDNAAYGPKLGFLGGLEASFDETTRYNSMFGAVVAAQSMERENAFRIAQAGGKPPPFLEPQFLNLNVGTYNTHAYLAAMAAERAFTQSADASASDAGRIEHTLAANTNDVVGARNDELRKLQQQYPDAGILTYDDIFKQVNDSAVQARRRMAMSPTTVLGNVGEFIGATAGFVDPRTNPVNFATLPFAGFGKNIITRMGVQFGGQAAAQAVSQFTGTQDNQRILGGNPTPTDALIAIGEAGLGGAVMQGAGEVVGMAARRAFRWFKPEAGVPPPPVRPPAPVDVPRTVVQTANPMRGADFVIASIEQGRTRLGVMRTAEDLDHAARQMGSWSVDPSKLTPPTGMRLPGADLNAKLPDTWQRVANTTEPLDATARRVDPKAFAIYDRLAAAREALRAVVNVRDTVHAKVQMDARATVEDAIASKLAQIEKGGSKKKIERLQKEVADLHTTAAKAGLPDSPAVRAEIQRLDQKMRDMAPVVSRAYARAQGKWDLMQEQHAQVKAMIEAGKPGISDLPSVATLQAVKEPVRTTQTVASDTSVATSAHPTTTIAEDLQAHATESAKALDTSLTQFKAAVDSIISKAEAAKASGTIKLEDTVSIEGIDQPLHLDRDSVVVPNEDGTGSRTMTVRQVLEDIQHDTEALKAIGSCPLAKTS